MATTFVTCGVTSVPHPQTPNCEFPTSRADHAVSS
jgi:hypothetical protein